MKHKNLAITISSVLFAAVLIAAGCLVCRVRVVTVSYSYLTAQTESELLQAKDRLNEYLGQNILAVNKKKVSGFLSDNPYVKVVSVEVNLPGELIVNVEERAEHYFIVSDGGYYAVTSDRFILARKDGNTPRNGSGPLAVIDGDVPTLTENSQLLPTDELFLAAVQIIEAFEDCNNQLTSVTVDRFTEVGSVSTEWNRIVVHTKEGAVFTLTEALDLTDKKIALLKSSFNSLEGEDRVLGKFDISTGVNGTVVCDKSVI